MSERLRPPVIALGFAAAYVVTLAFSGSVAALLPVSVLVLGVLAVVGWRLTPAAAPRHRDAAESLAMDPEPIVEAAPEGRATDAVHPPALPAAEPGPLSRLQWLALAGIVALGAVLRLYALDRVPAGFFCDEASVGYNAYSILRTGRDEHGAVLPLFFRAFGEYKNPVYVYAAAASIAVLGLTELATRLPAALFGLATIPVAFLLGRRLFDNGTGLMAAGLLAVAPWHIHFSRIAFELIALPFFFGLGLWLCLLALSSGRRRHFVLGGLCLALSLYTYAVARLFVPLFLVGFLLLYWRRWRAHRTGLRAAALAFGAGALPLLLFALAEPAGAAARWREISGVSAERPFSENLAAVAHGYAAHFSRDFLFESGDPLKRHSVRGFGELYRPFLPWLALGVVLLLARRRRQEALLLFWLCLFPVAASLTREVPSATRTIDAIPVFELIVAVAVVGLARFAGTRARGGWRPVVVAAVSLAFGAPLALELRRYLDAYFRDYPRYAAGGIDGFQHGYRDVIRYMEAHRHEYELLMLTATDTNQSETLAVFYSGRDPAEYQRTRQTGYLVSVPEEYGRYPERARILYALRPADLRYFLDYDTRLEVRAPDGQVSFLVSEIRGRRPLLVDWLVLGPFDRQGVEAGPERIDPRHPERVAPDAAWTAYRPQFANLDLNRHFAARFPGDNPEEACAYLWTRVHAPGPLRARLDLFGSPDAARVYWNGALLKHVDTLRPDRAEVLPIALSAGANDLVVRSCETVGEWNLQVGVLGEDARPVPGLRFEAPPLPLAPGAR